ncbi:hypothetical protein M378DRAFT_8441 [Amanita muscaria Koide BX008]|uniref:Uncharacterized protein n=1 Tax=Amanita muscaria (strain Koide BX008) TaxID=946122 RepID=A0A0C2SZS1_AMAMK|nr:hypothetical protein M378DRAFT_8441 [Amanita muscaria Koide BX008]
MTPHSGSQGLSWNSAARFLSGLPPLDLLLDLLLHRSSLRTRALHHHTGIHSNYELHNDALTPKGTHIVSLHREGFVMPPYKRSRQTKKKGPLLELLSLSSSVYEPSPYDSVPLGLRARDLFQNRIKHLYLPPKGEDIDQWILDISAILNPIMLAPGYLVLASPPGDVKKSSGAYSVQILPVMDEAPHSTHPHASNHHELTMMGLVNTIERIMLTEGHQYLLARNLSALITIMSPAFGRNQHYAHTADRLLKGWFLENPANSITLGWFPHQKREESVNASRGDPKRTKTGEYPAQVLRAQGVHEKSPSTKRPKGGNRLQPPKLSATQQDGWNHLITPSQGQMYSAVATQQPGCSGWYWLHPLFMLVAANSDGCNHAR